MDTRNLNEKQVRITCPYCKKEYQITMYLYPDTLSWPYDDPIKVYHGMVCHFSNCKEPFMVILEIKQSIATVPLVGHYPNRGKSKIPGSAKKEDG